MIVISVPSSRDQARCRKTGSDHFVFLGDNASVDVARRFLHACNVSFQALAHMPELASLSGAPSGSRGVPPTISSGFRALLGHTQDLSRASGGGNRRGVGSGTPTDRKLVVGGRRVEGRKELWQ
jgi:hypothetical protein